MSLGRLVAFHNAQVGLAMFTSFKRLMLPFASTWQAVRAMPRLSSDESMVVSVKTKVVWSECPERLEDCTFDLSVLLTGIAIARTVLIDASEQHRRGVEARVRSHDYWSQ